MTEQNLFPLVCGVPLVLLTLVVAIIATRNHFRFGKQLLTAYKDKSKMDALAKTHEKKHRFLALISLFSIIGLIILTGLIVLGVVFLTKSLFVAITILILSLMISGTLFLIDSQKYIK